MPQTKMKEHTPRQIAGYAMIFREVADNLADIATHMQEIGVPVLAIGYADTFEKILTAAESFGDSATKGWRQVLRSLPAETGMVPAKATKLDHKKPHNASAWRAASRGVAKD